MVSSIEESEKFDCGSSGTGMLLSSSSVCDWKYKLKHKLCRFDHLWPAHFELVVVYLSVVT